VHRVTRDRGIDYAGGFPRCAGDEREIDFFNGARGKLFGKILMRGIIFRHDQTAARFFIDAMNNAGPLFSADAGKVFAMMQQRVDERVLLMPGARMNDKTSRLVDYDKIDIFKKNIERDFFRGRRDFSNRRFVHAYDIPRADEIARSRFLFVQCNEVLSNQILQARPREVRELDREVTIKTRSRLVPGDAQFDHR